jgi:hypothetical protein
VISDITSIEARSPITPPFREPIFRLLHRFRTGPVDDSTSRHRSLGSISGAGSHPRVGCGRVPGGNTRLVVRSNSSRSRLRVPSSCSSVLSHVTRSKRRTSAFGRNVRAMTLDELRWVGMDDCDLPVLSVFKDLHPRDCWVVLLATFVARIRLTFTAPVRLRFRHAPSDVFGRRIQPHLSMESGKHDRPL